MSLRLRLWSPRVKNVVRVNRAFFIGEFIKEALNELTSGDHHPLDEIVEVGIVKHQYIGEISIRYFIEREGGESLKVAEVTIRIDWERFKVNIAGLGPDLEIDGDKKKIEQVSNALVVLFRFLEGYRKQLNAKTDIIWQWAPGIDVKQAKLDMNSKQAAQFQWAGGEVHKFGAADLPQLRSAIDTEKSQRDLEYEFAITPKLLDEIKIIARVTDQKRVLELLGKSETHETH